MGILWDLVVFEFRISEVLNSGQMERTLLIVKPDGVERNLTEAILSRVEKAGFRIAAVKVVELTEEDAKEFYQVHKEKPFYDGLTAYMSSGKVAVACLEREDAVRVLRELAGATDPKEARPGTLRSDYGKDVQKNTVHAADSIDTARSEIQFFFADPELKDK